MCSWIPFWQIVGIGGTGETWEASMKCELDALSHGHEECEFNNVVLICGKTWNWTTAEDGKMSLTEYRHVMCSQNIDWTIRKKMHFAWANGILTTEPLKTEKSWCKSATRKQGNSFVDPQKGGGSEHLNHMIRFHHQQTCCCHCPLIQQSIHEHHFSIFYPFVN